jgi:hypothetical protein
MRGKPTIAGLGITSNDSDCIRPVTDYVQASCLQPVQGQGTWPFTTDEPGYPASYWNDQRSFQVQRSGYEEVFCSP